MEKHKVTIITPVYNSEGFIESTISCVLEQTYSNWEMILVDDCSNDGSESVIKKLTKNDQRFKYFKLEQNSGAAVARNAAIKESTGRFVAFLDSDDLWRKDKLEKQVSFMLENKIGFSCTDYEVIDENGLTKNKIVSMPKIINYNLFLRNTIIQTVGVMVDTELTGRDLIEMPLIRRRQDAATWCKLLKAGFVCHGLNENLCYYRRVSNSLSANKFKAVKGTWFLYRGIEKLSIPKACFCFVGYAVNACKKRIYIQALFKLYQKY